MDAFQTHGAFSWSELTTTDPEAALSFYKSLFGWSSENMDMGTGAYHVVKVGDAAIGGVMSPPPGAPSMPPHWGVYVTVTDVVATVAQARELGGQVYMDVMQVPGVGRMAVLADPQGAAFNVMQYDAPA